MPFARVTDPETSHQAADSVKNLGETKQWILNRLSVCSMTDEMLLEAHNRHERMGTTNFVSPSGLRSRRAELVRAGLVQDSGLRLRLPSGRNAIVWEVVNS